MSHAEAAQARKQFHYENEKETHESTAAVGVGSGGWFGAARI